MFNKQGADAAIMALAVRDTFVQVCLMGQCPGSKPGVPGVEIAQQVGAQEPLLACSPFYLYYVYSLLAHITNAYSALNVARGDDVHLKARTCYQTVVYSWSALRFDFSLPSSWL